MQTVSFAGSNYNIPNTRGDRPWSGLSDFVIAAASKAINTAGGSFTLLADINFGASFGLVSTYYKSRTASVADAGQIRLAKTDVISWRNNAGGANIDLSKDTSDNLKWNATKILLSGAVVNADINAAAAIAYSKLALTGSIVNADVNSSAAIAYSKLALTGSILNADINASAAIAYSKLALTGSILNADVNSAAAIAYSKLALTGSIVNADVNASAAIAYSKLALGTSIVNADISNSAAIAYSKLNLATSIVNGDIAASTINLTTKVTGTLPVANGGTGVTASTGTVAVVLSTTPTLVTPILGVAAATSINFGDTALANYKEGTFTPVLNFGGATTGITYGTQTGRYTRIGRMVQYEVRIILTSKGSATGSATITGLPFTAGSRAYAPCFTSSMAAGVLNPMVEIDTVTLFLNNVTAGASPALSNTDFTNTTTLNVTGTYSV